jgi:hypothetical protein
MSWGGNDHWIWQLECLGNAADMLWWSCCCYNVITTAATLPMLGAKQGQNVYIAGRLLPLFLALTANALIAASMNVLGFLLLCHGQLVPVQT